LRGSWGRTAASRLRKYADGLAERRKPGIQFLASGAKGCVVIEEKKWSHE
jgi:hypothetical protein